MEFADVGHSLTVSRVYSCEAAEPYSQPCPDTYPSPKLSLNPNPKPVPYPNFSRNLIPNTTAKRNLTLTITLTLMLTLNPLP